MSNENIVETLFHESTPNPRLFSGLTIILLLGLAWAIPSGELRCVLLLFTVVYAVPFAGHFRIPLVGQLMLAFGMMAYAQSLSPLLFYPMFALIVWLVIAPIYLGTSIQVGVNMTTLLYVAVILMMSYTTFTKGHPWAVIIPSVTAMFASMATANVVRYRLIENRILRLVVALIAGGVLLAVQGHALALLVVPWLMMSEHDE